MPDDGAKSFGEKLQSVPKQVLYLVLAIVITIPLLMKPIKLPDRPDDDTVDLYANLMKIPEGSSILIGTDWTNSTRGESGGEFEAVIRILMQRNIKFGIFAGDPQAPQVAKNEIRIINDERVKKGQKPYVRWNDYVMLGFFPDVLAVDQAIAADVHKAFAGKKDIPPGGSPTDVYQSPVMKPFVKVSDVPLLVLVTGTAFADRTVERLYGKIPLAFLVTGVMGPETYVYYSSKQLVGLCRGLKGVYDLEYLIDNGINFPDKGSNPAVASSKWDTIPSLAGKLPPGRAGVYYAPLHFALLVLILAVVAGNVGMFVSSRRKGS